MDKILDDYTPEAPESQENLIEAFTKDSEKIDDLITMRRRETKKFNEIEQKRGSICDKIAALKAGQFPTLEKRIRDLEFSDLELFNYIRKLERLQYVITNPSE